MENETKIGQIKIPCGCIITIKACGTDFKEYIAEPCWRHKDMLGIGRSNVVDLVTGQ